MSLHDRIKDFLFLQFEEKKPRMDLSVKCLWSIDKYLLSILNELERKNVTYCVAGGYPAFLSGKIKLFTDINIYLNLNSIDCRKEFVIDLFKNDEKAVIICNSGSFMVCGPRIYLSKGVIIVKNASSQTFKFIFTHRPHVDGLSREIFCFEILRKFDSFLLKSGFYVKNRCLLCLNYNVSTKKCLAKNTTPRERKRRERKHYNHDNVTFFSPNKLSWLALEVVMSLIHKNNIE
jgi:hypothetical protein